MCANFNYFRDYPASHEIFHPRNFPHHSSFAYRASGVTKFKTTKINSEDPRQLFTKICTPENYPHTVCSQLINKPRVVVTDLRLHHTCSILLWLHSLSGVIRSLLCNTCAFSPGIIIISVCANTQMYRNF